MEKDTAPTTGALGVMIDKHSAYDYCRLDSKAKEHTLEMIKSIYAALENR